MEMGNSVTMYGNMIIERCLAGVQRLYWKGNNRVQCTFKLTALVVSLKEYNI